LERQNADLVISYDDPKSIQLKSEYVKNNHLGGIMIWNLGADVVGDQTPLLDSIAKSFGTKTQRVPTSGLAKTLVAFTGMVKDAYGKLSAAHDKLIAAGKADEAKAAEPGPAPDLTLPTSTDSKVLAAKLVEWETTLGIYDLKLQDCQAALNAIPVPEVVGVVLHPKKGKKKLLVDDFEKGLTTNKLMGDWMTDCDKNSLGTTLNPMPFQPTKGGHKGSSKYAAHISGHFGKSTAPWPYATLTATLAPGGAAVDLSQFTAVEFWVKGDGKVYSLALGRAAVQDYCNFREEFKSTPTWTKVTLKLKDFTQPAWGKQVPFKLSDVLNMTFSPGASFSDEDYDLWVDDVTLIK
jgi:chitinase